MLPEDDPNLVQTTFSENTFYLDTCDDELAIVYKI
jgi:hypothetical protein